PHDSELGADRQCICYSVGHARMWGHELSTEVSSQACPEPAEVTPPRRVIQPQLFAQFFVFTLWVPFSQNRDSGVDPHEVDEEEGSDTHRKKYQNDLDERYEETSEPHLCTIPN